MTELHEHSARTRAATEASLKARKARKRRKQKSHKRERERGIAPIPSFDLKTLAHSQPLTIAEAAGFLRKSINTIRYWRNKDEPPLRFTMIAGRPMIQVSDLLKYMSSKAKR